MCTESRRTQTAISISILTSPCAIRDLQSVRCHAGHRTYRQHRERGNAKKRNESRLYCETIIIPHPSSIAAKDRCRNPPMHRSTNQWFRGATLCAGYLKRIGRFLMQQQIKVAFKPLRTLNSLFPLRKAQEKVDWPQTGTVCNCFVSYCQTEQINH